MADRVRFGTYNDTVTPALSSGFNGFPIPTPPWNSDPSYFISISLAQAIEWWWRIAERQIATDLTTTGAMGGSYSLSDALPLIGYSGGELGLIGPGNRTWSAIKDIPGQDIGFGGGGFNVRITLGVTCFGGGGTDMLEQPDTIHPLFAASGVITAFDPGTGNTYTLLNATSAYGATGIGSTTGHIDSIPFTMAINDGSMLPVAWNYSGSSFDITPLSYFPYAAANGSPIYNTTTGAQLQSPRN